MCPWTSGQPPGPARLRCVEIAAAPGRARRGLRRSSASTGDRAPVSAREAAGRADRLAGATRCDSRRAAGRARASGEAVEGIGSGARGGRASRSQRRGHVPGLRTPPAGERVAEQATPPPRTRARARARQAIRRRPATRAARRRETPGSPRRRATAACSRTSSGAKSRVTRASTQKIASPVHRAGLRCRKWPLSCSAIWISRNASASARSTSSGNAGRRCRRPRPAVAQARAAARASRRPGPPAPRATSRAGDIEVVDARERRLHRTAR